MSLHQALAQLESPTRPPSIDKHLADFERFFGDDEWQFGSGVDFHAMRAVRGLRRYITKLERQAKEAA